ncbi:MAG: UTP--glucose-1-phosphate uridylyltransferase [Mycoplasmataceae bacterium]|jgi:UTP--glucose-1-phosphate uridylyltransferase|nr:UTP--glucose-1-phosphate uridylyltransferase [Mycoplasmataceae bacterium]
MSTKITKAVIPAAGLGSRFLPVTKSIPKEMIPILDTPTIDLIVQEAIQSGIKDILIIVSFTKHSIQHFYRRYPKLEKHLLKANKQNLYDKIANIAKGVNICFKYQVRPKGLGHAIYLARKFVGNDPFAILLGDDVILKKTPQTQPAIKQLMEVYEKYHLSVVGVKDVAKKDVSKYGIINPEKYLDKTKQICEIESMIEKPTTAKAPSTLAITGRYILTPEIFKYLGKQQLGYGGEIQLTDAIIQLLQEQKVYAINYEGIRYDIGAKSGLVKANIDFALKDPEISQDIKDYIVELAKTLK